MKTTMRVHILRWMAGGVLATMVLAGQASEEKKETAKSKPATAKAQKGPAASRQPGLPKGAVLIGPGQYRWVDPQGKKFLYTLTPFGYMGGEEPADFNAPVTAPPSMTAEEEGDSVRFTNPTPFGTAKWVRKKTELTALEQAAWTRQQAKKAPENPAPTTPAEKK